MGWLAEVAATVSCQGTPSYEGAGGQSWLVFRWVDLVMSKSHEKSVKLQVIALREYSSVADKCLHRSPDHRSFACLAAWYRICYTDIGLSVFGSVNINKAAQIGAATHAHHRRRPSVSSGRMPAMSCS